MSVDQASSETSRELPPTATGAQYGRMMTNPFLFVPISTNDAARGRGSRTKTVRAHVTRIQHARSATFRQSSVQDLSFGQAKAPRPRKPKAKDSQSSRPQEALQSGNVGKKEAAIVRVTEVADDEDTFRQIERQNTLSNSVDSKGANQPPANSPAKRSTSLIVRASGELSRLASPTLPVGTAQADPFWTYPAERLAFIPTIIHHYILNVAVDIPDLDTPDHYGLLRTSWFPLVMTEPSTFYAVLLMAASHYCIMQPHLNHLIDLLSLKTRALKCINEALHDQTRATSDAVIGAVAKMAAYEALFGDNATFASHMKGLKMMLSMRGGLADLGLNGLLERMLVWIDLNAAHVLGTKKLLGDEDCPSVVRFPAPDPFHFAGIS